MFCRKCGAQLREDDIFCSKCGACVEPSSQNNEIIPDSDDTVLDLANIAQDKVSDNSSPVNDSSAKKKKSKKPLIITLSVIAVLILAGGAFAAFKFASGFHLSAGDKFFDQGRYEEAADAYEEVLETDPENTQVRINLAKAYMEMREYDDVIETLSYLLRYDDGDEEVYQMLITACGKEREYDLADEYYQQAKENKISVDLDGTGFTEIPDLINLDLDSAGKFDDISVSVWQRKADDAKEDTILSQQPKAGVLSYLDNGKAEVSVTVSSGPGESLMKDYSGETVETVKADLGENFDIDTEEESSSTIPEGKVVRTVPAAGETLKKGDHVTVYISSGEKIVSVPKIVGKTYQQAEDILDDADLELGKVTYESSSKTKGTVITQNPAYKDKVSADTYVDVVVSNGQ